LEILEDEKFKNIENMKRFIEKAKVLEYKLQLMILGQVIQTLKGF